MIDVNDRPWYSPLTNAAQNAYNWQQYTDYAGVKSRRSMCEMNSSDAASENECVCCKRHSSAGGADKYIMRKWWWVYANVEKYAKCASVGIMHTIEASQIWLDAAVTDDRAVTKYVSYLAGVCGRGLWPKVWRSMRLGLEDTPRQGLNLCLERIFEGLIRRRKSLSSARCHCWKRPSSDTLVYSST